MIAHDSGGKPGYARFHGPSLVEVSKEFLYPHYLAPTGKNENRVIVEIPCWRGKNTKASPDSLITLGIRAGIVAGRYEQLEQRVQLVHPHKWKGNVPKNVHHPRIKAALCADELALIRGASGDMLDAVGLGLWELGRLAGP